MNAKTLLALICLLAVAQARPAPSSSSDCSLSCSGRKFWTGYESGTTLKYGFEQKVELSSSLNQEKSLIMQVTGKANVEVHGDCEMLLTVDVQNSKTSKSPSEATTLDSKTLPSSMVAALKEPLRFAFQNGRVESMCPSSSETRASLNFKRGLLSQLHLSIDRPDQEARVRENDVLGNCWTVYKQLGDNKLEKTKDLSSCSSNFEVFPRMGVKYEAPESNTKWPTVVKGNLKCTIELDSESMVIKENSCVEDRVLDNNVGEKGRGERVKVTTKLRMEQKMSSVASALFDVIDRSDLKHSHKTGDSCHDSKVWFEEDIFHSGNECLEKKLPESGTASSDFKALAKRTIEELCEETRPDNMLNSTAAKYADLVKYMRGITSQEDFTGLFDWVKNGYCKDNSMMQAVVYSAIPSVGTRQSVKVILNQLKGSDGMTVDKSTANWLANGIAMMPHPTPEIITDVLAFTKQAKEETMMIVSKDQPLALAAITGRYCTINTDCETNEAVAAVLNFFSNSLGTNCSKLEKSDDQTAIDYAFASLLSIGNIGRAAGGANFIIGCAENTKLSVAHRTFALRSLRRFSCLEKRHKMRLGDLIKSKKLDSEIRITAYMAIARFADISFWSDERVISSLSEFMQDEQEDQQVQAFIYSHLSQWMQRQKGSTDSYTVLRILRQFLDKKENAQRFARFNPMQRSSYWRNVIKEKSSKSKMELESNLIYSKDSMLPRFVNFNVTVESPLSGEAVNMMEFGVRMEGLEGIMEQVFNTVQSGTGTDELVRKRRQVSVPELTEEQKVYNQETRDKRLDFFTRKNGMELSHTNFGEEFLSAMPQIMKAADFANVKGLAGEKLSNMDFGTVGQSAGTAVESTLSIPTISGFPILLKKEIYYVSNIEFKQKFDMPSMVQLNMELDFQPTVSVHMARTVTVDSGFDRAGVKSTTSGLSSVGVKLSMEGKLTDVNDIFFSYKVDPLKKQQKIVELKTDVQFMQHNGPSNVVQTPVVSPSEMAPVNRKCFTPLTVKLFGRRMCLETNFERTNNPMAFVRQNPGSFRLYIDKDDSFGLYEATFKFKREGKNVEVLAVLGDQKSPDRHAKFQISLIRSEKSRKIIVEMANPVLPIKWESERKTNGNLDDITVDLKFGSTDYAFKGTKSKGPEGGWILDGNFYRKDKERQKMNIVTKFASYGLFRFLPLFKFDFTATTPSNDKLTFSQLLKLESGTFEASLLASHEKSDSVVTSVKSRLQCIRRQRGEAGRTRAIIYDTEVVNKNGQNFQHSFSAKVDRKKKDSAETQWQSTLTVSHKFKYGVSKEKSVLDFDANAQLEETIEPRKLYKATGSGTLTYPSDSGTKTATLTNLRVVLGEDDVIDDHFKTKTFLLEFATDSEGSQKEGLIAVQALPLSMWRLDNQCVYFTVKASKKSGTDSVTNTMELRHTSSVDPKFRYFPVPSILQVVKMVYANDVLLDVTHKFDPVRMERNVGGYDAVHFVNVTTYDQQTYYVGNDYSTAEGQFHISTTAKVNSEKMLVLNQSFLIEGEGMREYKMNYWMPTSTGSLRSYSKDYNYSETWKNQCAITQYLTMARRSGFNLRKFVSLVKQYIYSIKTENGFILNTPNQKMTATNYLDMTVTNGVVLNITRIYGTNKFVYSLHKEQENSESRYRRAYKYTFEYYEVIKSLTFEVIYKKKENPEMEASLSMATTGLEIKAGDFNVTTIAQFVKQYQRKGQVALNVNTTLTVVEWPNKLVEVKSKLNVVTDTEVTQGTKPALNVSLDVSSSKGGTLSAVYGLQYEGTGGDTKTSQALSSDLTITNTFESLGFKSYNGITRISRSPDELFNFLCRKTLDESDIINFQTTMTSQMLYIGLKSDILPTKEVSYKAQYKEESDGFKSYMSLIKFKAFSWDMSINDTGRFKYSGSGRGNLLFSTIYSGSLQFSGLEMLIGSEMSMSRLDYNGVLEAKTTGEFKNNFEISKVQGTTSENLGQLFAQLNYWPFIISGQIKTPLWNIDHYAFNITAAPKKQENGVKFKAWIASPMKQSSLKYWHTYTQYSQWFNVTAEAKVQSDHLAFLESKKIESRVVVTGNDFTNHTVFLKLTTPFRAFELMQWDIAHRPKQQSAVVTMKMNGRQENVFQFDRSVQLNADGTSNGNVSASITSIDPRISGWASYGLEGYFVYGSDYLWGMQFMKDEDNRAGLNLLWIKPGNSYPQLSRLSVPGANLGFEVYTPITKLQKFYLLRSGTPAKTQWQMYYKGDNEVQTKVELTDGKITSGSGTAFGNSITFSSPSDGVIEVTAASTDGTNTITWNSEMEGSALKSLQLKFSFGDKESCLEYKKEAQKFDVKYGSCTTPNTLSVTYSGSNIWNPKQTKVKVNIEHKTSPATNELFHLLPGVSVPLVPSKRPFTIAVDIDNEQKKGSISLNFPGSSFEFNHEYNFSNFPRSMNFKRTLKADMGYGKLDDEILVNYDMDEKTLEVNLESKGIYKITASTTQFRFEVEQIFMTSAEYTKEISTGKQMIELKGEWRPKPDSQPCVLRLWRMDIEGGIQYALEFVQHTGKELSIRSDVTNFKLTSDEFRMDAVTVFSSTLIESFRSANNRINISFVRDAANRNYTLTYQESFTSGGKVYYELESLFKGQGMWFPSTLNIALVKGYLESQFTYNFNPEHDSESYLRWALTKVGDNRDNYLAEYRSRDVSTHVGSFWRDFSLEISSPWRQVYLSENCNVLPNGTVLTEVQVYLNKRNSEGFTALFSKDFTKPNVYKRGLQLTLPTRKVGFERELKVRDAGQKLDYNIVVFWDMHSAMEKNVTVQFFREKENRPSERYYFYYHTMSITAPFLKNKVIKTFSCSCARNKFDVSATYTIQSVDKITFNMSGEKYWDSNRDAFQKVLNVSFSQLKGNVNANVTIKVDSSRVSAPMGYAPGGYSPHSYTPGKYLTVFNIYTVIPSQSIDSYIRIRSVPFEELTYACNHGATFSFRYYSGYERSRLSLFVSNSKKEAGQLTIMNDRLMSTWEATLDTGTGYMDPNSKLSFPFYKPTAVKVKATAGVSANRRKVHFGVVNGAMSVKSAINLWKPTSVPADLDFFFVGMKFRKDNTMNYVSHWRIRELTMKSPFTYLKEVLIDPWAKAKTLPFGTATMNELLKPVAKSKSENIDTDVVLDLLTSISSNDIDSLKRWASNARKNNEFLSNTIGQFLLSGFNMVKDGVESWVESVRSLAYRDVLPSDLGILSGISRLSDAIARSLSSVPVSSLWSSALSKMKYASDTFSYYFSMYVDSLDRNIREGISRLTGGRGSSVSDMMYNAVSSVYPVEQLREKLDIIAWQYYVGLYTADTELAAQAGNAMSPYIINSLSEIPKVYDFLDNLAFELDVWGVYLRGFISAAAKDGADKVEDEITGQSSVYQKNVASSIGLLLSGDYSGAIRKFFNTDANVVHVWRVSCDQACLESGSFASINGSLYLPFDVYTVISLTPRPGSVFRRGAGFRYNLETLRWKIKDAVEREDGIGGILRRLISPSHRTAEANNGFIKTFGGERYLWNLSPCRYLLAHDFLNSDFSIYQTYTWNGRRQRGDLLVRFFGFQATISNSNRLQLNGAAVNLPVSRKKDEQKVEATGDREIIRVRFSSELKNVLEVQCSVVKDSCTVRVHPLYHGRVNGAFGSNDGDSYNNLHANSDSEHMRLWTVDSCVMS